MRSRRIATALGLLAALSLTAPAYAGDQRPIAGHFTVGVVPVEQRCGPNALTIGFEGAGISTHLGRMTGTGSNCTEFCLAGGPVGIWDGIATYVAADGSSITTRYEGVAGRPRSPVPPAPSRRTPSCPAPVASPAQRVLDGNRHHRLHDRPL